jgi:hypothetical protein
MRVRPVADRAPAGPARTDPAPSGPAPTIRAALLPDPETPMPAPAATRASRAAATSRPHAVPRTAIAIAPARVTPVRPDPGLPDRAPIATRIEGAGRTRGRVGSPSGAAGARGRSPSDGRALRIAAGPATIPVAAIRVAAIPVAAIRVAAIRVAATGGVRVRPPDTGR